MTATPLFAANDPSNEDALFLGASSVVATTTTGQMDVRLPSGRVVRATPALAFHYEPTIGDDVLVIQKRDEPAWILGVIRSTGRGIVSFPGDLEIRAEGGTLTLSGEAGVAIAGPDVEVRAGKLRTFAGAVLEHVESFTQRVRELYSVQAGEAHTIVEGTSLSQSKRAKIVTEETVSVNGREIHLG